MKYSDGKPYKVIALCMAKFDGNEQKDFIDAFYKVCNEKNYKLHIYATMTDFFTSAYTDDAEEQIFELMEPERYDAVIIYTATFKRDDIPAAIARRVSKAGVPCISLVSALKDCINLTFEFGDSFEQVVRHMIEFHKPKHINFIAGFRNNPFSDERLAIFKQVMEENNIPIEDDRIDWGDFWEEPTERVVKKFLASGKPIDAIICANDAMAMEVCRQLANRGIKVPDDIIVSGFDGAAMEKYHYPRLATCEWNNDEFAEKITDLIDDIYAGRKVKKDHSVGCQFRAGESCGCKKVPSNRETVIKIGTKYSNATRHEAMITSHMEAFFEKMSILGNEEKLAFVWGDMVHFVRDYVGGDYLLAINDDFFGDDVEIRPTVRPMSEMSPHHYYTDRLISGFRFRDGVFSNGEVIEKSNLLPDLEGYFEKGLVTMFLPMHVQGTTVGYAVSGFEPKDFEYFMLFSFTMNVRHVLEMHKFRIDLQNLYSTDQLTKLLNRKGFYRHMEPRVNEAIRKNKDLAVISVDMNWLKQINDTYGHKEGDFALSKISSIMESIVGKLGVCTRFGGDEFAIAFTCDNAEDKAKEIISEIQRRLKEFNESKKKPYPLSVSAGYIVHVPDNKSYHLERYIVEADRKMYKEKTKFKETHHWEGQQEI